MLPSKREDKIERGERGRESRPTLDIFKEERRREGERKEEGEGEGGEGRD
jgi:hypothetical protein